MTDERSEPDPETPSEPDQTPVPEEELAAGTEPEPEPEPRSGFPASRLVRRQPILGTDWSVRERSFGEQTDMLREAENSELSDRDFVVNVIARQIVSEPELGRDEVAAWTDDQLLAGARATLSFPPIHYKVDGRKRISEEEAIPDPLTFASFRAAIREQAKRRFAAFAETARRINDLGLPRGSAIQDAMKVISANQADVLRNFGPGSAVQDAIDAAKKIGAMSQPMAGIDSMKKTLAALSDTSGIASTLARYQESTRAMEQMSGKVDLPHLRSEEYVRLGNPEVRAIDSVGGRIKKLTDLQA